MLFHVDAGFEERNAFGFKQFALQPGIRFADQQFSAVTDHAMPGNAFAGGTRGHCTAGTARSSAEPESFGKFPVSNNPAAGNSFYEGIHRSPGHRYADSSSCAS